MSLNYSFLISCDENWVPHLVCMGDFVLSMLWQAGSERHVVNMQIQRAQNTASCLSLSVRSPRSLFHAVEVVMGCLYSWEGDWQLQHRPECIYSTRLSVFNSLWQKILWKSTTCQNSQSGSLGEQAQKVRGNPCYYHFRLCQWQGVMLSGYTAVLHAEHILKRCLNCAS